MGRRSGWVDAFQRVEPSEKTQWRMAMCTACTTVVAVVRGRGNRGDLREQELEAAQLGAMFAMQQTEGTYSVKALGRRVLKEASAIGVEATAGNEHVDVRMPFEGARPRVEDGEGADATADETWIGAEPCERVERSAKEKGEEDPSCALSGTHTAVSSSREAGLSTPRDDVILVS